MSEPFCTCSLHGNPVVEDLIQGINAKEEIRGKSYDPVTVHATGKTLS